MTSPPELCPPPPPPPSPDGSPPEPPASAGEPEERQARLNRLFLEIEGDLRRIAHDLLKRNRRVEDVHTTVLVHDMFVRLSEAHTGTWASPQELKLAAAEILRNILTDAARRRDSRKRGGGAHAEDLEILLEHFERGGLEEHSRTDLLDLNTALEALAKQNAMVAKMVELRYYLGIEEEEIGAIFGVAGRTVRHKLTDARTVLKRLILDLPPRPDDPAGAGRPAR